MSKKIVSILTAIALVVSCMNFVPSTVEAAVNSSSGSSSWSLVWNDEFNQTVGGAPDTSTWSYDMGHGASGWGNNELQRYTNSTNNVRIADMSSDSGSTDGRALAITAKRENGEITSGRIKTLNKQYMKYGRIEARIRLDDGMRSGVWPAFWMMGNDIESGASWPYCGEIDIMEHRNAENHVISTLHWNTGTGTGANYAHVYAGSETTNQFGNIDSINNWHNYAVEWYEDVMKFYLDGVCFETLNINSSEMEEFQKEHFILLNLAIGSKNSPFTLGQTVSDDFQSATMYVDYVRVYQGNDSAFSIAKSGTSETKPTQTTTGDGFTTCSGEKTSLGGWGYYVLSGNAGKYQNGTNLDDEFVLKLTSNNKSAWGVQAFTKNISVTSGHKYNVSVDVNSSAATGDVLMKDEVGGTEFTNQALSAGNNTLTGSFTADSDTMQFMFNLANVDAGTTLKFSNVKVTDVTGSGEVEVTTTASGDSSWEVIGGGDANTWYYDKNSMSGISGVVNIQQPGFAKEMGIYINVPAGISSVSVNGNTEGVAAIQGAGVVVYLSALTKQKNTVTINYAGGTGTVIIKNTNGTSDDTTTEAPTQQGVTTSEDIQVLGYQISTTYEGIRTAAMVEPTINSQAVKSWGFVYGLENYNDTNTNITDTDMVVGSTNKFINSYQSTSAGTIGVKLGDSDTATYYARTMSFGKKSVSAFNAKYKVRAYAVLADGSYVYSAVTSYSISEVADYLYKNVLMNTVEAHTYLYENILSKVYNGYTQVDFQWNNTIIKPDQVTE
jgi:endo-1,3(4)-beta-glucanase